MCFIKTRPPKGLLEVKNYANLDFQATFLKHRFLEQIWNTDAWFNYAVSAIEGTRFAENSHQRYF